MLLNRSEKSKAQNKIGPYKPDMISKNLTQNTIVYKAVNVYNSLPKELTLCKNKTLFKKWLKRYYLDKSIILPEREYNSRIYIHHEVNLQIISRCENGHIQ